MQHTIAAVGQLNPAHEQIRSARRRVDTDAELREAAVPRLEGDERDLTPAAAIGAAVDALPLHEPHFARGIHRATVGALDPDCLEPSALRGCLSRHACRLIALGA